MVQRLLRYEKQAPPHESGDEGAPVGRVCGVLQCEARSCPMVVLPCEWTIQENECGVVWRERLYCWTNRHEVLVMPGKRRLLVIDNLAVESARRGVYRVLATMEDTEIHLLVPQAWRETTHVIQCEPEEDGRLHIHHTSIVFGFRHHRVLYTNLFQIIKQVRPHFVLAAHAPENYATLQLLAARKFLLPSMRIGLFASRNIDLPSVGFPFKLAFANQLCDSLAARSKVDVIYHRPQAYGHLYKRYADRTVYVPHHVDCSVFTPEQAVAKRGKFMIGYVGRLTESKGVDILIEAVAKLSEEPHLTILGEGPESRELHSLVQKRGLVTRVQFGSSVPYAIMPRVLNQLDVLVLPSRETAHWKELFGRILIEAMACGVPVVASNSGGIPEVVGDAGLLFKPASVVDLVQVLSRIVVERELRAELGRKGRERVLRLFDTSVIAKKLAENLVAFLPPMC
jgi:glycosyltransferase involved in cell wall biosynthesis